MSDSQFDFDDNNQTDNFYDDDENEKKDKYSDNESYHSDNEQSNNEQTSGDIESTDGSPDKSYRYDDESDGDEVNYSDDDNNNDESSHTARSKRSSSSRHSTLNGDSDDERASSKLSTDSRQSRHNRSPSKSVQQTKKPPLQNGHAKKNGTAKSVGRGRGRGSGTQRGAGQSAGRANNKNQVVDRVLSANRNKARALHNVIYELQQQVDSLTVENKDLKRAARLQDREIRKLDGAEAELPSLLKKHSAEMRVLQERGKRQKEASDKARDNLKRRDMELIKVKEKLKRYEDMAKEQNLPEKSTLNKKVETLEKEMEEKDKKIADLSRAVQLNDKVRNRELREKNVKYSRAIEELKRVKQEYDELQRKLKDKEKALEVTNIYSQRLNNQRRGSKESQGLFAETDPVPAIIRRLQEEQEVEYAESVRQAFMTERGGVPPSEASSTARGKMITEDFEAKRSEKKKPKKAFGTPQESPRNQPVKTLVSDNKKNDDSNDENDDDFYAKKSEEQQRLEDIDRKLVEMKKREEALKKQEKQKKEEDQIKERLEKEKELEELEEAERQRQHEISIQQDIAEQKRREEEERKMEEDRRRREEEVRKQQQDNYRRLEEEEEQRRREKESNRNNAEEEEKKRKRELLKARLAAIDREEDPNKVELTSPKSKPRSKKPIFLQSNNDNNNEPEDESFGGRPPIPRRNTKDSMKVSPEPYDNNRPAIPRRNTNDSIKSNRSEGRRNSWDFKQTDENLHKGLPSNTGIDHSPNFSRRNTEESIGSGRSRRQPVASGDRKNRRTVLMDEDLDTAYSPSSQTNSPAPPASNNTPSKKKNSPFDQFDDPFSLTKPKAKPKSKLVFSSDEEEEGDELDTPSYQPSKPVSKKAPVMNYSQRSNVHSSENFDDDLEEMLIA